MTHEHLCTQCSIVYYCDGYDCVETWEIICNDCKGEDDELDPGSITDHIVTYSSYDVAASTEAEIRAICFSDRPTFLGLLQLPDRSMGFLHPYYGYDLYRFTWDR